MNSAPTPKDRFTSLDTLALAAELRRLDRARAEKAFDYERGGWTVVFRVPGEGRRELLLVPGRYGALVPESPEHAPELSPFAKELRRLLSGAVLRGVAEPGGERLLELSFGRASEPQEILLEFEIFGSGNLLVARGGRIAAVAHPRQWAHRSVRVGAEYVRPPTRTDPWKLSRSEIEHELGRSRTDLASTLAARLALGGPIAEELIARADWPAESPASADAAGRAERLWTELERLRGEVIEHPRGYVYLRGEVAVDATPYRSARWRGVVDVREEERPSFSVAAHEYFSSLLAAPASPEEVEAGRVRRELLRLEEQQRSAVEELTGTADRRRAEAEAILAHYPEAERLLLEAPPAEESDPRLEVELGGLRVPLVRGRTPREAAQALFEESKRAQAKLVGAREALEATARRLAAPAGPAGARPSTSARAGSRRKHHWFERYRWFVSSEGVVVVGGRDAATNDLIVKRHLKEGDVYLHADLHGAASVVAKHPEGGAPVTEATLREAGQWAVAFSKAWRAGHASGSAFWVSPDQVSKAAATGEFVARGAWVIHGTKNFLKDLPLELGLGTIDYAGESLWTVAPPSAFRGRGAVRVLLIPGPERERGEREVELARELGIPRPLLQSLLPAGGISVRRP